MHLLAKSKELKRNSPARTLKEHIDDCLAIYSFLRQCFPRAANCSGLGDNFWKVLKICIVFHDIGKAHREFQKLLEGKEHKWNFQRHELFSLPFVDALLETDKNTIKLILLVIAGHHKDFKSLRDYLAYYDNGDSFGNLESLEETESFEAAFHHNIDLNGALQLLGSYGFKIKPVTVGSIYGLIHAYNREPFLQSQSDYFKLMLLFGGLKWCDHLGSALVSQIQKLENTDFKFLEHKQKALNEKGSDFYEHQKICASSKGHLILTAPTGSGKTESAFLWVKNQLSSLSQGRVFYILPFTASISAMYERMNTEIGKENEKVGMLHGKLSDYLNNYFDDLQYDLNSKKDSIKNIKDKYKSIITPVKIVTPFQLLKHLFGLKGYEQGIFEMSGCYLIFDEIHAYSPDTFAQIKVLLEFAVRHLEAKVMIMTATLPHFFLTELTQSLGQHTIVKASLALYDTFKRHKVILKEGKLSEHLAEIRRMINNDKKVLVVCNTVRSAQDAFSQLKVDSNAGRAILLHGSFTGQDRSKIEKQLMNQDVKLLVGTQAIEVSLDIDYDIIFTEPAPIDALIQRFGRVNRKREKGICDCIIFKESNSDDKYIYNSKTVDKTLGAFQNIADINNGVIDESMLQNTIDLVYDKWLKEDREDFDEKYKYLNDSLQMLSPMFRNKHTEEDFYKQFDGIKILPQSKREDFEASLSNFDFITAESLKVQVTKGRFIGWKNSLNIKSEVFAFHGGKKTFTISYYITNKLYNPELGLMRDEEEPWKNSAIF